MVAGKGGDGGAEEGAGAEAPEAAQPVVLKMELHCAGCAQKVKKAIKRVPGVQSVMADAAANRVVVAGTADAAALKARIEAKTRKAVEVISAGGGAPKKAGGGGAESKDAGGKKGDKGASPKEEKEKKQPPEEKKPKEETVLLKIRLHCDGCADRIRRRIYKIKGVRDVVLDVNAAKDEVKITGTMDVPAMLAYLTDKLNRAVEAVPAPGKKDGGGEGKDDKKDKGGVKSKGAGGDDKDKGKGVEEGAGPSTAAAAAFMSPAPAEASTYHVTPPYGHVAYPQVPAPTGYYPYPYYGNADGMGHANPSAATYYYHQHHSDASQHHQQQQQAYPPYPYGFDMAPPSQLFRDENPNACSVM